MSEHPVQKRGGGAADWRGISDAMIREGLAVLSHGGSIDLDSPVGPLALSLIRYLNSLGPDESDAEGAAKYSRVVEAVSVPA